MNQENDPVSNIVRMPLRALGLRTGMALQTRRMVDGTSKVESQYFGAIEGKGVMVGPLGSDSTQTGLEEGEVCVVRGFTGQYEFSFLSKVLQTFEQPFVYALLAYPAQVDSRMVRQSMRTKMTCPTTVRDGKPTDVTDASSVDVTLVDISMAGAMIKAPSALAAVGQSITVSFSVNFEGAPVTLSVEGCICHNNKSRDAEAFFLGMSFKNLTQHDKLVLHYMTQTSQT